MLKKQTIKNFQSHKDTTIEFHPGVTYIIGDNDAGKSAIMRSLGWIINNVPNGFSFKSHFAGKNDITSSIIEFNKEAIQKIIRERDRTNNQYRLDETEPFRALSGKVPDEIKEAIKLDDINLQNQYSPYFLLNDTPGKVAEKFNEVFGLQIIDTCLGNIKKIVTEAKSKYAHTNKSQSEKLEEIKNLSWIDGIDKLLVIFEDKEKTRIELKDTIDKTDKILTETTKIEEDLRVTQSLLTIVDVYETLEEKNIKLLALKKQITSIESLVLSIEKIIEKQSKIDTMGFDIIIELIEKNKRTKLLKNQIISIESLVLSIERTEQNIVIDDFDFDIDVLIKKDKRIKEITTRGKKIAGVVRSIIDIQKKIKSGRDLIKSKEIEFHKMLKDCEICPLCGEKIKF